MVQDKEEEVFLQEEKLFEAPGLLIPLICKKIGHGEGELGLNKSFINSLQVKYKFKNLCF